MSEQKFLEAEFSPSVIKRTWSWRHREGAAVDVIGDPDSALLELLSLEEEQNDGPGGLTSQEAYKRLLEVVQEELAAFCHDGKAKWTKDIWTTLQNNPHSSVSWSSIVFFVFEVCVLIITYGVLPERRSSLPLLEGMIVLFIAIANVILCVREENMRRRELYESTKYILDNCGDYCNWNPPDYIDPCTPSSPSISLTHAYRDGALVNVPCNLLVNGDVIVLGPSQSAPACVELIEEDKFNTEDVSSGQQHHIVLVKGEIYNPELNVPKAADDATTLPCQPKPRKRFLVKEAPFKATLNFLLKNSSKRPVSILENEKHYIASTVIEKRFLWLILGLSFLVNLTRFLLLSNGVGHWSEVLLLLQGYVILPLLPLSFPVLWISTNLYSASRIRILFDKLREESLTDSKVLKNFPVRDVLPLFWKTFVGNPSYLPRTSNLLQVLGNITVWCCVDKDGILALPNPSVEKVFFLQSKKSVKHKNTSISRDRKISSCTWESDMSRQTSRDEGNMDDLSSSSDDDDDDYTLAEDGSHLKGRAAVLNITTDPDSQFGLRFDDKRWPEYLNSLKPLGLNILLNSPCSCPVRAMRFVDHTAHLSLARNPSPILTPRRCLCLLGKEIGFTDQALSLFTKKQHIVVVHTLDTPVADCPLQSSSYLAVCKERPVPAMACLVVKETHTGVHQLLSQGSADLVLDACTDFWDGSCLNTITSHDKKKVLDFYQRNSLSSQCVAFAYRPCSEVLPKHADVFLKLPSIYQWKSCESVSDRYWFVACIASCDLFNLKELSVDNGEEEEGITFNAHEFSLEDLKLEQLLEEVQNVKDTETYHKLLGGQVFIGMLTLQYQAIKDIIPLVEDLNKAGIRFVHFSSEDELKSRVFAERMGLETGWNCHISLSENGTQRIRSKTETSSNEPQQGAACTQSVNEHEHDGDEKHVSWIDIDIKAGSSEKVCRSDTGASTGHDESEKSERTTLLGDEQNMINDDYWFFYNRAKLPRGVHNIRPHLENIDNVPLLVPLFTDCTPQGVKDMIAIMQEYGEVVCCVGSSFNVNNTSIFAQADISVCIEPLFPQLCLKGLPKDFRSGTPRLQGCEKAREKLKNQEKTQDNGSESESSSEIENVPSPLELSALLNSLPCALSFPRDSDFKFKSLFKEARRLSFGIRKCFTFILTCQLMLSMVVFLSHCLLLPPPLTGLHLLWLSCITVPLLSISLIASKPGKGLMSMMTGRNDRTFEDITCPFCLYFCCGFLPTCFFICVVLFPLTLNGFCVIKNVNHQDQCHFLLGYRNSSELWNGLGGQYTQVLSLAQDLNAFSLVLFFAIISTSFVHRLQSLWRRTPFTNRHWLYAVIVVLGLQLLYFIVSQSIWLNISGPHYTIKDLPPYILILVFLWPIGSLLVTELLKRRYIKLYVRFQKRAKLKFGTKLGMNSPF